MLININDEKEYIRASERIERQMRENGYSEEQVRKMMDKPEVDIICDNEDIIQVFTDIKESEDQLDITYEMIEE